MILQTYSVLLEGAAVESLAVRTPRRVRLHKHDCNILARLAFESESVRASGEPHPRHLRQRRFKFVSPCAKLTDRVFVRAKLSHVVSCRDSIASAGLHHVNETEVRGLTLVRLRMTPDLAQKMKRFTCYNSCKLISAHAQG